jgi:CheY-like chemotaxis protein
MIRFMTASVLVIDDDAEFRALAGRLLTANGLRVVGEADGVSAALAAAIRLKPTRILVDAELPDGDGIRARRHRDRRRRRWRRGHSA